MKMIERYAVEAGVEGNIFVEGSGREYLYLYIQEYRKIYGNTVSFNENHLTCRVRIIGYIWVTLIPVKRETPSLEMKLNKLSIMARVWFALHLCTLGHSTVVYSRTGWLSDIHTL